MDLEATMNQRWVELPEIHLHFTQNTGDCRQDPRRLNPFNFVKILLFLL